jgi:hypothetical protein
MVTAKRGVASLFENQDLKIERYKVLGGILPLCWLHHNAVHVLVNYAETQMDSTDFW